MLNCIRPIRIVLVAAAIMLPGMAAADLLQSQHFRLDPNVSDNFGGDTSSQSYKLTDAGGEGAVGSGSSQSYALTQGYTSSLDHSIQLSVVPAGTYAYWPFDTGSGPTAYDVGPNGDDATLIGSPTWAAGMVGQAVTLNGSSQYVTTPGQVAGPTAFTIECWFKSTSTSGGLIMGFGDAASGASTNRDRLIYLDNAGHLIFGTKTTSYNVVTSTASYNDGSWHHVAASLGSRGLRLYVDGLEQAADPGTTTAGSYSGYWRLGYDDLTGWPSVPTSSYLAGTVDEARVITRALRDAEVTNDCTAGANALAQAFTLPSVTPGQSQNYSVDAVVRTDAAGYDLYVQRPHPLTHTDGTTTIPDLSGTIASPAAWTEGVTKGFGFTLTAGTGLDAKWGSSPNYNYAALPSDATIYHSRTGLTAGARETTTIQYRADTLAQQKQGTYSTTVIYTATIKP
jgi:hypothetical protein